MKRIGADLIDAMLRRALVTKQGIELVHAIREGEPLEPKPRIQIGGIRGDHVSTLMDFTVRLNHATLQSALLHELDDRHSDCREYYSWPMDVGGVRYSINFGTRTQVDVFRPFLLKISEDWCGFVDAFPTSKLKKSVMSGSALFEEVDEGHWTCPAIAERLSPLGLRYQIVTEKHFGLWHLPNIAFLRSFHQPSYKVNDPAACESVVAMVKAKGYMFRRDLLDRGLISADDLNYLIITRRVFFPLSSQDVTDMRSAAVFRDATAHDCFKAAKAASEGFLSLKTTGTTPSTDITSKSEPDFIQFISPDAYTHAQHKLRTLSEKISYWWSGSGPKREGNLIPPATKALWRSQAELGELLYGSAAYGLIPRWHERGFRAKRFPESERLWDLVFIKHRLQKRWTLRATHGMFTALAKRLGLPAFSERTAKTRDKECDRCIFVKYRDGNAACYAIAGHVPPDTANRLYQTTVPFFLAHIDHTPLAIKLENSVNGRRIKTQVWLTVMIDAATGAKLAWTVSFGSPSAAAVMTVLFECVDKHRCLPRFIVVDNAPEFASIVMHRILQEAESHILWRPPYQPRFGAPVEAANNKITVQSLQRLAGNTVAVKGLYDYSRTFVARNPELMTLTQLNAYFRGVFDEVELEVGSARTGDEPVKDFIARREAELGVAYRKQVEPTISLRRLCMPPASGNGHRTVRDEGYVVVDNIAYCSEELKRFRGKIVRVFPDLIHVGIVYVYISNEVGWVDAKCIYTDFFALYSKREVIGVIAELKLGKLRGVRDPAFISAALAEEMLKRERDPRRKDQLAQQFDRLQNRAPSLLKTEEESEKNFNPPPVFEWSVMSRKNAFSGKGGGEQISENIEMIGKMESKSTEARSDDKLNNESKEDLNFDISVRPSRRSF